MEKQLSLTGYTDEEVIRDILSRSPIIHDWRGFGENNSVVLLYISNRYLWIIILDSETVDVYKYGFDAVDQLKPTPNLCLPLLVDKRYYKDSQLYHMVADYIKQHAPYPYT